MNEKFEIVKTIICLYLAPNLKQFDGFHIGIADKDKFEIKYMKKKYYITIIKEGGEFYWLLEPYNNSIYKAKIKDDPIGTFDRTMFAILDDYLIRTQSNTD